MRTNSRRRFALAVVVALVTTGLSTWPTSAAAVNLTGTWSGKAVCKGLFNGNKTNDIFQQFDAKITQSGADLNMSFFGHTYAGGIQDDNTNPTKKAQGTFIDCATVPDYNTLDFYSEMGSFSVTVNTVDDTKTTLKANSVYTTGTNNFQTCKWTFKRVDMADPGVGDCSLLPAATR
jgi:hypothetical protein